MRRHGQRQQQASNGNGNTPWSTATTQSFRFSSLENQFYERYDGANGWIDGWNRGAGSNRTGLSMGKFNSSSTADEFSDTQSNTIQSGATQRSNSIDPHRKAPGIEKHIKSICQHSKTAKALHKNRLTIADHGVVAVVAAVPVAW
jgi:hypothetical protein